jgi:SMC interacting uncharacterized protein involved in chromosome segregation
MRYMTIDSLYIRTLCDKLEQMVSDEVRDNDAIKWLEAKKKENEETVARLENEVLFARKIIVELRSEVALLRSVAALAIENARPSIEEECSGHCGSCDARHRDWTKTNG